MRQALGPGALGRPRGSGWRGKWEGGLGWGTHVNPWLFHFNGYNKKKKRKVKKNLRIELTYDSLIALLDIYPKELKVGS